MADRTIDLTDTECVVVNLPGGHAVEIDPYLAIAAIEAIATQAADEGEADEDAVFDEQLGDLHEYLTREARSVSDDAGTVASRLSRGQLFTLHEFLYAEASKLNELRQKKTEPTVS